MRDVADRVVHRVFVARAAQRCRRGDRTQQVHAQRVARRVGGGGKRAELVGGARASQRALRRQCTGRQCSRARDVARRARRRPDRAHHRLDSGDPVDLRDQTAVGPHARLKAADRLACRARELARQRSDRRVAYFREHAPARRNAQVGHIPRRHQRACRRLHIVGVVSFDRRAQRGRRTDDVLGAGRAFAEDPLVVDAPGDPAERLQHRRRTARVRRRPGVRARAAIAVVQARPAAAEQRQPTQHGERRQHDRRAAVQRAAGEQVRAHAVNDRQGS